jgi:hypothetical protein
LGGGQVVNSSIGLCGEVAKPYFEHTCFDERYSLSEAEFDTFQCELDTLEWSTVLMPNVEHIAAINMLHWESDFDEQEVELRDGTYHTIDCPWPS